MELTINERIALTGILAQQQGRILYLRALRQARHALELDDTDYEAAQVRVEASCPHCHLADYVPASNPAPQCPLCQTAMVSGQRIQWSQKAPPRDISLGSIPTQVIAGHLRTLEANEKLTDDLLDLYDKFCTPPTNTAPNNTGATP